MYISTGNFDLIFFLGITPFLNFDQNEKYYSTQFVSAIPLKPLNRISLNFVVMKDIICIHVYMHIHRKFDSIFFLRSYPLLNLEIWPKWKILLKQFVSAPPLKPFNRISWNFEVMKDLTCRCTYLPEILIQFFSGSYAPFWT